jgi:hypothetical protein
MMNWSVIFLVLFVGGFAFWKLTEFGRHLAKMTTIFGMIEITRYTMPIGAGGGFESLPQQQRIKAEQILSAGMA